MLTACKHCEEICLKLLKSMTVIDIGFQREEATMCTRTDTQCTNVTSYRIIGGLTFIHPNDARIYQTVEAITKQETSSFRL